MSDGSPLGACLRIDRMSDAAITLEMVKMAGSARPTAIIPRQNASPDASSNDGVSKAQISLEHMN